MGTKFVSKPRKLEAVILQTVANCASDNLGAVKLHKVLYYLDMLRFLQFGEPVTGSTYRKRPHGPTCEQLPRALRNLEAAGKLSVSEVAYFGFFKKEYTALEPPPPAELTNGETDLLSQVIDFVCFDKTAKEISEISHALPWELAMDGGEISYESAYLL
ncbi:MAG: Panacea domain-containing protein, partial [Sandaracinobacter sp.]